MSLWNHLDTTDSESGKAKANAEEQRSFHDLNTDLSLNVNDEEDWGETIPPEE